MPVFISHRTADDKIAQAVAYRLKNTHDITVYIDDIDKELAAARGTGRVTQLLVDRLHKCTNLLAIVTSNTQGSWWVPFEIGVAREAPRMISTFTDQSQFSLPDYLTEWPVLRGESAVDTFAKYYKLQSSIARRSLVEKTASASEGISSVDSFHRQLKNALGQ
jgi:hypothetical protein